MDTFTVLPSGVGLRVSGEKQRSLSYLRTIWDFSQKKFANKRKKTSIFKIFLLKYLFAPAFDW